MPVPAIQDYPTRPRTTMPLLSVVTTVRNGEKTLSRTLDSVRAQNIEGLEYILVDAASTDHTLDIVRTNADIVSFWKSEPDRGISDGFNKGIALAHGKYVQLLNADDWLSPGQLAFGIETLETTGADFVFGDMLYHRENGELAYRVQGDVNYAKRIAHVMPALNHPTVIVRRAAYEHFGLFDLGLRYAMDYELLLRLHNKGCVGVYDSRIVGHMTLTGASDTGSWKAIGEVREASITHGYPRSRAHFLCYFRLLKDRTRRLAEVVLPRPLSVALRGVFNKDLLGAKKTGT